jgi:hypothetical protein
VVAVGHVGDEGGGARGVGGGGGRVGPAESLVDVRGVEGLAVGGELDGMVELVAKLVLLGW